MEILTRVDVAKDEKNLNIVAALYPNPYHHHHSHGDLLTTCLQLVSPASPLECPYSWLDGSLVLLHSQKQQMPHFRPAPRYVVKDYAGRVSDRDVRVIVWGDFEGVHGASVYCKSHICELVPINELPTNPLVCRVLIFVSRLSESHRGACTISFPCKSARIVQTVVLYQYEYLDKTDVSGDLWHRLQ